MSEKQKIVEKFLGAGRVVRIHLDGRIPDARLPKRLSRKDHVILEIGLAMPVPIPDLLVNDFGFSGTLRFGGKEFEVFVPWVAVFAVDQSRGERPVIWHEDVPASVSAAVAGSDVLPGMRPVAKVINLAEYRAKRGK